MAKTQNEKKKFGITIAELIAILAFALFAVFSYFGYGLKHGMAMRIASSVGACGLLLLISMFLKKCKAVESDFTKWRIMEALTLLTFIGAAYFLNRPIMTAISATENKSSLINYGKEDINAIRALFSTYERAEDNNITTMRENLRSYSVSYKNDMNDEARKILDGTKGSLSTCEYIALLRKKYLGAGGEGLLKYKKFKDEYLEQLESDENDLENWNLLKISDIAVSLRAKQDTIANRLTKISSQAQPGTGYPYKYLFYSDYSGYHRVIKLDKEGTKSLCCDYTKNLNSLEFQNKVLASRSLFGELSAWGVCLLMLLPYLAAYRSSTVEIGRRRGGWLSGHGKSVSVDDGGISLYD